MIFVFENLLFLGEFGAEFKKALPCESGSQGVLLDEKNWRLKNSWHCPFKNDTSEIMTTGMPDYSASRQSGTGLKKTNDAGAVPVPE
jgi:hypothetical protein